MAINVLKKRLPSEYQEVEYIESTGAQYIDLGIKQSNLINYDVTAKFEITAGALFGISNNGSGYMSNLAITSANFFSLYYNLSQITPMLSDTFKANISLGSTTNTANFEIYKNNVLIKSDTDFNYCYLKGSDDLNLCLFKAVKVWWSEISNTTAKLGYFKIYDRNQSKTICEMIPCYRKSDNEVGMYDLVNGVFYTNAGTGTFTKGNDVNNYEIQKCKVNILTQGSGSNLPAEYQEVEYIQGSGDQYIDTGVNLSSSDTIKCKFELTATPTSYSEGVYGAMESIGGYNTFFVLLMRSPNLARVGTSANQVTSTNVATNTVYDTSLSNGTYIENGTTYTFTPHNGFTFNTSCYVFKRNQASMTPIKGKIYSFEIVGKFNGIPCYRKADNVIGMYDTVSETFFTNSGTGNFTKGVDKIIPSTFQEVEYIQLDNTAPQTTGILLNTNYTEVAELRIKYEMLNEVSSLGHPMIVCGHTSGSFESTTPYTCIDGSQNGNLFVVNYTTKTDINNPREFIINARSSSSGLIKFGGWNDSYWTSVGRYYYAKTLNGSYETTHWLIPVCRKADGEIGLYDVVGETFYPNGGTGTMTKGDDVGGIEIQRVRVNLLKSNPNYHNLPSEYQEVEFIESTGTQYIDLGMTVSNTTKANIEFMTMGKDWGWVLGGYDYNPRYYIQDGTNNSIYMAFTNSGATDGLSYMGDIDKTVKHSIIFNDEGHSFYLDGVFIGNSNYDVSFSNNYKLSLFAKVTAEGSPSAFSKSRIYSCKIYSNYTTLKRNLIPCYRKLDNVLGMYDTVSETFFTNSGTGTFEKGADVVSFEIINI